MGTTNKPLLRLHFTDFGYDMSLEGSNYFLPGLRERYEVVLDPANPDYLFHSVFGTEFLDYSCTRIFYTGENITPDFNLSDYAIGFDYLDFGERYFRLPIYQILMEEGMGRGLSPDSTVSLLSEKQKFCSFLYTNNHAAAPQREAMFRQLSEYKRVDSGGKFLNNIGGPVPGNFLDCRGWQRGYKFGIAFENASKPGYTTEKIFNQLVADAIPIYWGDPRIAEQFNPDRIINCHEFPDFDAVVERVRELDRDDEQYLAMVGRPWFAGEPPPSLVNNTAFWSFLDGIFAQGPENSRRVVPFGWSKYYLRNADKRRREQVRRERKNLPSRLWKKTRQFLKGNFGQPRS